jgi:hypothetical protein
MMKLTRCCSALTVGGLTGGLAIPSLPVCFLPSVLQLLSALGAEAILAHVVFELTTDPLSTLKQVGNAATSLPGASQLQDAIVGVASATGLPIGSLTDGQLNGLLSLVVGLVTTILGGTGLLGGVVGGLPILVRSSLQRLADARR